MIELESRSRSARTITTVLRGIVFAGLTFVAACGKGDDLIGPGGGQDTDGGHPGPDQVAPKRDLSGAWTMNVTFGNDAISLSCSGRSQVSVKHSGSSISGQYTSGTATCTGPGGTASGEVTGSFSGTISGDQVSFQENDGGFRFTGTISTDGKRMEGNLSGVFDLEDGQQLELSGNWSASR